MSTTENRPNRNFSFRSFSVSLLFHIILFAIILFIVSRIPQSGTPNGERTADSVGIVFNDGGDGKTLAGTNDRTPGNKSENNRGEQQEELKVEVHEIAVSESFLPDPNLIGFKNEASTNTTSGNSNIGQVNPLSELGEDGGKGGTGLGTGKGGQTVSFSDVKGNGRKFVYVLDRSESMNWSNAYPMKYALEEARNSIASLDPKKGATRVQLVYYNHEALVYGNKRLLEVNEQNKNLLLKFLDTIFPDGGTDPVTAIEVAAKLSPDVIFFLTDADEEIPNISLARIHELARKGNVRQIHVVEFGKGNDKKKNSFRQLALENNGQYIFKKID